MKKFFWKIKFTYFMWKYARITFSFIWEAAQASIDSNEDWLEDGAECCVDEEMQCWHG